MNAGGKNAGPGRTPPPAPPGAALRTRLLALAGELAAGGDDARARALRATVEAWWTEQEAWLAEVIEVLRVHHEINNALVGVRGNTQLLLMAPVAEQPGVRERLEVVLRESTRIRDAAARVRELKTALAGPGPAARAA